VEWEGSVANDRGRAPAASHGWTVQVPRPPATPVCRIPLRQRTEGAVDRGQDVGTEDDAARPDVGDHLFRPGRADQGRGDLDVAHDHDVGRDRDIRRVAPEHLRLRPELVAQRVGREPREIQLLGGFRERRGDPRRLDLLPGAVVLAPEVGRPGAVQRVQIGIPLAQPPAEALCAELGDHA
jgi:hypothetical protein